jgi:hypothetical protein
MSLATVLDAATDDTLLAPLPFPRLPTSCECAHLPRRGAALLRHHHELQQRSAQRHRGSAAGGDRSWRRQRMKQRMSSLAKGLPYADVSI